MKYHQQRQDHQHHKPAATTVQEGSTLERSFPKQFAFGQKLSRRYFFLQQYTLLTIYQVSAYEVLSCQQQQQQQQQNNNNNYYNNDNNNSNNNNSNSNNNNSYNNDKNNNNSNNINNNNNNDNNNNNSSPSVANDDRLHSPRRARHVPSPSSSQASSVQ